MPEMPDFFNSTRYENAETFSCKVAEYFSCLDANKPPSLPDLILHLNLESRGALNELASRDGFREVIEKAKMLIESDILSRGMDGKAATLLIFRLKNLFPEYYRDKEEKDLNISSCELFEKQIEARAKKYESKFKQQAKTSD